jgi:predicted TIM-barrel fold metal-dependent hydrolase
MPVLDDAMHRWIGDLDSSSLPAQQPDPERRDRQHVLISVDDHLVEPPDIFTSRVPANLRDRVPRVVEEDNGREYWLVDGALVENSCGNATAGFPEDEDIAIMPIRFDEIRSGTWNIADRVKDMDINGVWASVGFPSMVFGFAGQRVSALRDPKIGQVCVKAYNDWVLDEWAGPYPDRIIPAGITWFGDPELAAQEVYRTAARGMKAVNFSENPSKLGYPSINSGAWDPFLRACEETDTVINLHIGSSSEVIQPSPDSPIDTIVTLFGVNAIIAATEWIFSAVCVRFPKLNIALSEGGIGWVPMLLDRLEYERRRPRSLSWNQDIAPADVLRRNFWFASFWDPSMWVLRDRIGIDHIMLEVDYPHVDGTWPNSQPLLSEQLAGLPPEDARKVAAENAARLYRHPMPSKLDWDL